MPDRNFNINRKLKQTYFIYMAENKENKKDRKSVV